MKNSRDEKKGKTKKIIVSGSIIGFIALLMVIVAISHLSSMYSAKKAEKARQTAEIARQQREVAEAAARPKLCPEDLAKCEPCEGAKNFEWPLDKNGKPLPQMVVDVSATNCWTGYVITPKKVSYCIYPETDQYIQFQDGSIFLDGPARVNNTGKRRGIFRFMALKSSGKTTIK